MADIVLLLSILALSVVGFANALYFTLVTYRAVAPDSRWIPRFCRMDGGTCARVVDSKYARLLGLPNPVYGMAWYAVAAAAGLVAFRTGSIAYCLQLLTVAVVTVLVSIVLAWSLIFRLRIVCVLCFLGHAINVALLLLLLAACG